MGRQLGLYLREQRKAAKLTVTQLATDSGVSRPMVNYVEMGKREPSIALIVRMAGAIGIEDLSEVFRVVLTEQAQVAMAELGDGKGKELLSQWLANPGELYPELKARVKSLMILVDALCDRAQELGAIVEGRCVGEPPVDTPEDEDQIGIWDEKE